VEIRDETPGEVALALLWAGSPIVAQQTDALMDQLQQLKQQYADTTRALEQRIAALERQITEQKQNSEKTQKGTISTAELAVSCVRGARRRRKISLGERSGNLWKADFCQQLAEPGSRFQQSVDEDRVHD